jgi:hypothetical protein
MYLFVFTKKYLNKFVYLLRWFFIILCTAWFCTSSLRSLKQSSNLFIYSWIASLTLTMTMHGIKPRKVYSCEKENITRYKMLK